MSCCALAAVEVAAPGGAWAQARQISIEAAPLPAALAELSRQTGIAIGYEGLLPGRLSRRVSGRLTAEQALSRMLEGTGLKAQRLSPVTFRLIATERSGSRSRSPSPSPSMPVQAAMPLPPGGTADIVVTGTKREEPLASLPISVAVVEAPGERSGTLLPGTADVARQLDGLTLTNLGPGRNRQFIRGVADSPFNGNSQSTVAILVNDARATYNAPDPDLRLVDVERVELLKGPQGSLYGTGTLGGVFHIVTRAPDPAAFAASLGVGGSIASHGDAGGDAEAMVNLPLAQGLALRGVAYAAREPGWIDTAGRGDANRGEVEGLRLALRALPGNWTIDVNGVLQLQDVADSQYVFARHRLDRPAQPAEPHDNDFAMASLHVAGKLGDADFVYAANWVDHDVSSTLDASALSAAAFGVPAPALYAEQRRNRLLDQEVRLSRSVGDGLSWLGGLSFMDVRNHLLGVIRSGEAADMTVATGIQQVVELSAFGEIRVPVFDAVTLSVGGRLFHSRIEEERGAKRARVRASVSRSGFTPSLALSWQAGGNDFLYLRYAGALRPGGLSQTGTGSAERFESDELQTAEAGWRHAASARLTINASGYFTAWSHMQSDYLLSDGLIGTRNVGDARIIGAELAADWTWARGWALTAGLVVQSALLTRTGDGTEIEDRHLPVIPDWTMRLGLSRSFDLLGWSGTMGVRFAYTGRSRLSFDPGLDRRMGDYALADADLRLRKGAWGIRLSGSNLSDSQADSFAFGNPFALGKGPQYTPLQPRQWTLSVTSSW